jgi:hypothetical protein
MEKMWLKYGTLEDEEPFEGFSSKGAIDAKRSLPFTSAFSERPAEGRPASF